MSIQINALILAAGKGTRMKEDKPKVLTTIFGKPFISYVIESLQAAGVSSIIPIIGYQAQMIEAVLPGYNFVYQTEQLGTGHAVKQARSMLEGQSGITIVIAGDQPFISVESLNELLSMHVANQNALTLLTIENPNPYGYGRILREGNQIIGMVEESDASETQKQLNEVNLSTYCFDNQRLFQHIDEIKNNNAKQEFYINDLVSIFNQHGYSVQALKSTNYLESIGINDKVALEEATNLMKESINTHWMKEGVTIIDKHNTYIGPDVTIGAGTTIYPGSVIEGAVTIGQGCTIESSYIRDSIIGNHVTIGPFAHIRNQTVIGDDVRIGNFVEVKKSNLDHGVKAAHLTYLGDSTIGQQVNIGCGTITVNYDGVAKHHTVIEAGAFIGSNVNLIAPITIGKGAKVAAGSTVTEDVPAHSLAIARPRQTTKVGYYAKKNQ
jgi:bifunctional UDP-N-acetylglucosamine pyrophosphorylase / glucosamine-1-phosphate N-acetyltransferase